LPSCLKTRPTVAGVCAFAVELVNPTSPKVLESSIGYKNQILTHNKPVSRFILKITTVEPQLHVKHIQTLHYNHCIAAATTTTTAG